ncbi:flagellar hook-length control protein FliK [Aeromonas lusitana]|uniref:Flagellar hook-length control protein FliK n=1 Tax=Aeromonas lusitana TaxID=931529 RepID=A0A2M8H889_9GAMM|nr:flagellar hook-length control protein FliK [Aeromonas lusitana]PJC92740.1 flagellar hook-length control protein FliK [Aeromonas lusitana]
MIQTQLIKAATQATPADSGVALAGLTQDGAALPQGDGKVAFADAMALAQRVDKGSAATPVSGDELAAITPDAKSLAAIDETTPSTEPKADKAKAGETELPPDDFLQQLQASLRQDTSLILPVAAQATQAAPLATDGNDLPPESQSLLETSKPAQGAAGQAAAAQQALLQQAGGGISEQAPDHQGKADGAGDAGKGAQNISASAQSTNPQPIEQSGEEAVAEDKPVDATSASSKPTTPLSGEARAALLAKVVAGASAAEPQGAGAQVTDKSLPMADKSQQQTAQESATNGAGADVGTPASPTVQASAAKAFGEGLVKVDTGVNGNPEANRDAAADGEEGSKPSAAAQESESKPAQAAATKPDASATGSAPPVAKAADPDPVMAAPQQVLARHESQGPQASLTALSAGIQQMEAEPAVAVRAAADLKQAEVKPKFSEPGKQAVLETKGLEQSESASSLQPAQTQASDNKPAAEVAARREAQSLPHLKLATPEAPTQLHQKVNLMLADKLQQAEIQLDPLGLGKMKIQIQMGADSQANVNFVVQHGQTREMLEQAMPRLRDMLAGQGIQLGQTQVQQQSQQQAQQQGQPSQQQGQSAFNGQEQRGQQGSGSFAGNGQGEGGNGTHTLSLLVESTNDAGIDFYA